MMAVEAKNVCKVYLGGKLYNIEPILPAIRLNLTENITAIANLCEVVPLESYIAQNFTIVRPDQYKDRTPNSIVVNNNTKTVHCITFGQDSDFWTASIANWPLLLSPNAATGQAKGLSTNNSQEIVFKTVALLTPSDKLKSIKFKFKCERDPTYTMRDFYFDRKNKELIYGYTGPNACPLDIPDYIMFFSNNVLFLGLLFCSSVIGLFLGRRYERVAMSLTSLQAAVMVTSAALISSTQNQNFKTILLGREKYFGLALISVSFFFFGLSYFSKYIAVFFVCISVSYSVTWTFLYLCTMVFESRVSFMILGISTGALLLLIVGINWIYPQLRERYSFGVYTALTNPFFLVMSVGVYMGYYLDVIAFNQYSDWGKIDKISWKSWMPLTVQVFMTFLLIAKSCFESHSSSRVRSSTNLKKLTEQLNEDKNLFKGSDFEFRESTPSAVIQM